MYRPVSNLTQSRASIHRIQALVTSLGTSTASAYTPAAYAHRNSQDT